MAEKTPIDTKGPAQPTQPAGDTIERVPSPVKDFDPGEATDDRRTFPNGDTDRTNQN